MLIYELLSDGTYGVKAGTTAVAEETIVIPSTYKEIAVTQILSDGFKDLDNLKTITISDTVTRINQYAFQGCEQLDNVIIPEAVTFIGAYAFYNSGVKNVTLQDSAGWRLENYTVPVCAPGVIFDTLSFNNYKRGDYGTYYLEEYRAVLDLTSSSAVANALKKRSSLVVVRSYSQTIPASGATNVSKSEFGLAHANFYTENWIK